MRWMRRRAYRAAARGLALGVALTALALAAAVSMPAPAAAHPQDSATITIAIPATDANGIARGPVGAYLTLTGAGFTDGDTYQLGYVPQGQPCPADESAIPTFANGTVKPSGGGFTQTVQWPAGANNVNGKYAICALDTTNVAQPPVQSSDLFEVVAASAPAFTLQIATSSAPLQGPPYLLPAGSQVTISGQNFAPGGLTLIAYLAPHQIKSPSDLNGLTPLSTTNATTITTQDSGNVAATVQLPASVTSGTFYLYLVSNDNQGVNGLPSLMAFVQVTIAQQPTATPQPSPTATPKATATATTGTTGGGSGVGKILGVIGLSLLSLILLIAGVLLLAGGPRRTP